MRVPRGWHDCGTCKACDGTGQCASTPPDDNACGITDCDKLDTACRDYQDLTTGRCEAFGTCKTPNDAKACSKYTELTCGDAGFEAGQKKDKGAQADAKIDTTTLGVAVGQAVGPVTEPPPASSGCVP